MTVEEIFEQSEARLAERERSYQPVGRLFGRRRVTLERECCCDRCREAGDGASARLRAEGVADA